MRPGEDGETHQFLHHINNPLIVGRGLHPAGLVELLEGLGHAGLVGDGDHPHPAAQQAQSVDGVEALRPARHLHHRQGAALGRAQAAQAERQMVDLQLHQAGDLAMPFRTAPDHALRPEGVLAQLAHRRVVVVAGRARQGQVGGVEDAGLASHPLQQTGRLLDAEPRIRPLAQRAVQEKDPRRRVGRAQSTGGVGGQIGRVQSRQVIRIRQRTQAGEGHQRSLIR